MALPQGLGSLHVFRTDFFFFSNDLDPQLVVSTGRTHSTLYPQGCHCHLPGVPLQPPGLWLSLPQASTLALASSLPGMCPPPDLQLRSQGHGTVSRGSPGDTPKIPSLPWCPPPVAFALTEPSTDLRAHLYYSLPAFLIDQSP